MTYLVERLAELRRHVDHLREIGPRVTSRIAIERDLSLHNDVMFSLLMVAQLVVDLAGELSARRGDRFEDYTGAIHNLARDPRFPADLVHELERVPGFRNVVIHEYVALDLDRVVEALRRQDLEALLGRPVEVLTDGGLSPYFQQRILAEAAAL